MRRLSFLLIVLIFSLVACNNSKNAGRGGSGEASRTIGWEKSDMEVFGFTDPEFLEQQTGPGLVFVQGGTFIMGRIDEDVLGDWDNQPRRVTVASFYMDETEVTNYDYRQYLAWLGSVYPNSDKVEKATPDTLVWRSELAYNEPYVNNYLRHPSYSTYPVVGVNWVQAADYCKWRTDRVNEYLLIENGYLSLDSTQQGSEVFTTEGYLSGYYQGVNGENDQRVRWENGLLLPNYRLPTEAEWEYAALGLIGEADGELLTERRMYPWSGTYLRQENKDMKGKMRANYTRGRGDLMGMAGALNDGADISADVFSYEPNDYGIYCMAGNVNEWVADVYRPLSPQDVEEFQPFRGNVITEYRRTDDGAIIFNEFGQPVVDTISDFRNYKDGDYQSALIEGSNWNDIKPENQAASTEATSRMYIQNEREGVINSMITDHVRVYKGGSWRDRAYWLNPGSRRYLEEAESRSDLGFRCAMTRLGPPRTSN
ncbi:SUMF1/EgtB/PvdO family nonheme iron enzyme [Roseimarinus sediminis]|jgi:formylglycine-generating enzyme required for sulfatase activity|uniref:SUMF1/EgtB/PvdO family nonheme iron enzyme n=1 Tax=Roseimarinus sediminis TaxID=1610899 RepID=UPI003D2044A1